MSQRFMVLFDEPGFSSPMCWDEECEGALCTFYLDQPIALFETRELASQAIEISRRRAQLCQAQGKPANSDFLPPYSGGLRIVTATHAAASDRRVRSER